MSIIWGKARLLAASTLPGGTIRTHYQANVPDAEIELVPLNNLLTCISRFGFGEFVLPQDFFELCELDLFERTGEEAWRMRRTDGSYRRILQDCVIWVAEPDELAGAVLHRPSVETRVLRYIVGSVNQLAGPLGPVQN